MTRTRRGKATISPIPTAKPIPRWDVHFWGLEDDLKDSTAPHITFTPQLGATGGAVWRYVHFTLASV